MPSQAVSKIWMLEWTRVFGELKWSMSQTRKRRVFTEWQNPPQGWAWKPGALIVESFGQLMQRVVSKIEQGVLVSHAAAFVQGHLLTHVCLCLKQSKHLNENNTHFCQWCFASDGGALYVLKCEWNFKAPPTALALAADRAHYFPKVTVYQRVSFTENRNDELGHVSLNSEALKAVVYLMLDAKSTVWSCQ
jgi:hypothetical protein